MPRPSRKRSRGDRLKLILIVAAALVVLVLFAGSHQWLSVDSLKDHRDALERFVDAHYWGSLLGFGLLTVGLVAISVPASAPLILLSGMIFGRWVGSLLMLVTCALGATLAMLVVRYLAHDFVAARVHRYPRARKMVSTFRQHQDSYLLFLRFIPGFPFWLTNILYGLTEISALRFLLLTLAGIAPDVVIYCNVGANLAHVKSAHELLSPGTVAALSVLALLSLSPVVIQRLQRHGMLRKGWPL